MDTNDRYLSVFLGLIIVCMASVLIGLLVFMFDPPSELGPMPIFMWPIIVMGLCAVPFFIIEGLRFVWSGVTGR